VALTPITLPPLAVALHLNLNFSLKPKPIMSLDLDRSHPPSLLLFNPTRWSLHVSSTTSPRQHHSTMVFSLSSHFFLSNPSQTPHSSLSDFLFLWSLILLLLLWWCFGGNEVEVAVFFLFLVWILSGWWWVMLVLSSGD